jgi:hypothetical protein
MNWWMTSAMLVLVSLAGCADEKVAAEPTALAADGELQATSTTGVIRGVVVDTAISPIAGVTIKIVNQEKEAVTLEDGSFGFQDMEPGTYFLTAKAQGYSKVQSTATVVAGVDKPPLVRIALERLPSEDPFYQVTTYKANLRCGFAIPSNPAGIGAFGCSLVRGTEDVVGENNAEVLEWTEMGVPDFLQVDMYWKSTQPAGDSLILDIAHCCDNGDVATNSSTFGPSPLHAWATLDEIMAHDGGAIAEDGIEIRVFPSGNEQIRNEAGQRVGVIVEQNVEWFTSQFWNSAPPEGWNFIDDGEPQ